jgi:hypothetical protein
LCICWRPVNVRLGHAHALFCFLHKTRPHIHGSLNEYLDVASIDINASIPLKYRRLKFENWDRFFICGFLARTTPCSLEDDSSLHGSTALPYVPFLGFSRCCGSLPWLFALPFHPFRDLCRRRDHSVVPFRLFSDWACLGCKSLIPCVTENDVKNLTLIRSTPH